MAKTKEAKLLDWTAQPRQAEFLSRAEDEVLYGGAGGGGKSDALLAWLISRAIRFPGSKNLYIRRRFSDMSQGGAIIDRSKELLTGVAKWDGNTYRWTFSGNSILKFGYLDSEDDKYSYHSSQWDSIAFDEVTQQSGSQYLYMIGRCRATIDNIKPLVRAGCNPGGPGHAFFKARFVDPAIPGTPFNLPLEADQKIIRTACFIPAKLQDNEILMKRDPGYWDRLMQLPEDERRAIAYGDWDVFAGQYFKEWRADKHVITPFSIPDYWRKWGGLDWGFAKPLSFHVYTKDSDSDRIYVARELYGIEMRDSEAIAQIKAVIGSDKLDVIYADPSVWQRKSKDDGISTAETYMATGLPLQPANNDRINGWRRIRDLLADGKDGLPMLQVFSNCRHLIRTLPALIFDPNRPEDLNCFVAGTKISIPDGDKNIEDIQNGDLVCTPIGNREVIRSGVSGVGDVFKIILSNGKELIGTPNHKVFVCGKGLVPLSELSSSDVLLERRITSLNKLSTRVLSILGMKEEIITTPMEPLLLKDICHYIGKSMQTLRGKSQKVFTYIISITITMITLQKILRQFQPYNMLYTTSNIGEVGLKPNIIDGPRLPKDSKLSKKMPEKCTEIPHKLNIRAEIVGELVKQTQHIQEFSAPINVNMITPLKQRILEIVLSVVKLSVGRLAELIQPQPVHINVVGSYVGKEQVYNLTVEEAGLYYANGILVTNTDGEDHAADDLRYAVVGRVSAIRPEVSVERQKSAWEMM